MIVIHNRLSTLDQEGGNEYEKTDYDCKID